MFFRYFTPLLLLSGLLSGATASAQDVDAPALWCADFDGQAGNAFASPMNFQGFAFEWNAKETGNVIETSAIGGDYLRAYSPVTVGLPLPSNGVTVRILSEGQSTSHDFLLEAFDVAGVQVASQSVHVDAARFVDVELSAPHMVLVKASSTEGPMNESGIQKVCVRVLAAP